MTMLKFVQKVHFTNLPGCRLSMVVFLVVFERILPSGLPSTCTWKPVMDTSLWASTESHSNVTYNIIVTIKSFSYKIHITTKKGETTWFAPIFQGNHGNISTPNFISKYSLFYSTDSAEQILQLIIFHF